MAIQFDGSTQTKSGVSSVTTTRLAISGWFYREIGASSGKMFTIGDDAADDERFGITVRAGGDVAAYVREGGSQVQAVSTTIAPTGQWHHVFAVFDRRNKRGVWLNGGGFNNNTDFGTPSPTAVMSFAGVAGEGNFLEGRLAEWAVWGGFGIGKMVTRVAVFLAKGFSPLCLNAQLPFLLHYQPFVRDTNWNSIGPPLVDSGGDSAAAHPRIIYPNHDDSSMRLPGFVDGRRFPPQAIMPLGLNFER